MDKKIIVIGAGHGGLYAARLLAEAGNTVTVYEKCARNKVSHNRTDCVENKLLKEINIELPEGSYQAAACSFFFPYSEKPLLIDIPEESRDVVVERGDFVRLLADNAEKAGAKILWETPVDSLIIDNIVIKGVVVNGEKIYADLVIDSSGVNSPFRASLPPVLGITAKPEPDEVFNIRHAYYERADGFEEQPERDYIWKLYLKYMCKNSICWVNCELPGQAGTLVGKIGDFEKNESDEIFEQLKKDNPIIGEKLIRGDDYATIPLRYASPVFVAEGYCLIGDSAFMSVPLTGCGMANAIRAAKILAEEIISSGKTDADTLVKYQYKFFKKIGAFMCLVDCFKRALLEAEPVELRYLAESGAVTSDDIVAILSGDTSSVNAKEILSRLKKFPKARKTFGTVFVAVGKGAAALAIAENPPKKYDLVELNRFKRKLDSVFN